MLDTFNELLIQEFSKRHPGLALVFKKAAGGGTHPDFGNWLNHPALASALPKVIVWLREVHSARVKADLAHAKSKKGVATKPVTYVRRDKLRKDAIMPWAELIGEWQKLL